MGRICSLLFSLPKDKADLNSYHLFLASRLTQSSTLIITNYQLELNTSIGFTMKTVSIKVEEMVPSAALVSSQTTRRCHPAQQDLPALKPHVLMLCARTEISLTWNMYGGMCPAHAQPDSRGQ